MKKSIVVLLISTMMLCLLVGCGKKESNNSSAQYEEDFDKIYNDISMLYGDSEYVANAIHHTWDDGGPDKVMSNINNVVAFDTSVQATAMAYADIVYFIEGNTSIDYKFGEFTEADKQKVDELITEFQRCYSEIPELDTSLVEDLKNFKSNYNDSHADAVSALMDYYTECSSYANLAMNPSGNYLDYGTSINNFKSSIESLKKAADLAK